MSFEELRRRSPGFVAALGIIVATFVAIDALLLYKRTQYVDEIARLRTGMDVYVRRRSTAIVTSRAQRQQLEMELVRREARWGKALHLSVALDTSRMYLSSDGAVLRSIPIQAGPARRVGRADTTRVTVPRGARTVERVLGPMDAWTVPDWVYHDRRLSVPSNRMVAGALGPAAIVLDDGTVIYSEPQTGPLADSSYVLPGAVRARASDLEAIVPDVAKGMAVYLY